MPPFEEVPAIKRFSMYVRHGFFRPARRRPRCSVYRVAQLRTGLGATPRRSLREPEARLRRARLGAYERLATPRQVHSAIAIATDKAWAPTERPSAMQLSRNALA